MSMFESEIVLTVVLIERQRRAIELLQIKKKYQNTKKKEQELFGMFSEGFVSNDQLRNMLVNHKAKKAGLMKKIALIRMSDISEGAKSPFE